MLRLKNDFSSPGNIEFEFPLSTARIWRSSMFIAIVVCSALRLHSQSISITTIAGSTTGGGYVDDVGVLARFSGPQSVAVDSSGSIVVADTGNHVIRKIAPDGRVFTVAGQAGISGANDGYGTAAHFRFPSGGAVDSADNIFVADTNNHTVRMISPRGDVSTVAGSAGSSGDTDGTAGSARFRYPEGVTVDSANNVYVADTNNHAIRKISANG